MHRSVTFRATCWWAFCCLLFITVTDAAPGNPDPCSEGYRSGSNADIATCAELAKNGGPNAEFGYALILWSGHSSPNDRQTALDWFRKSARQGHYLAQISLGRFLSDPSVEEHLRNPAEAYAWWSAADAKKAAAKLLATLSASEAAEAKRLATEFRVKYAGRRPLPTDP